MLSRLLIFTCLSSFIIIRVSAQELSYFVVSKSEMFQLPEFRSDSVINAILHDDSSTFFAYVVSGMGGTHYQSSLIYIYTDDTIKCSYQLPKGSLDFLTLDSPTTSEVKDKSNFVLYKKGTSSSRRILFLVKDRGTYVFSLFSIGGELSEAIGEITPFKLDIIERIEDDLYKQIKRSPLNSTTQHYYYCVMR